jgi:hypothetical protein
MTEKVGFPDVIAAPLRKLARALRLLDEGLHELAASAEYLAGRKEGAAQARRDIAEAASASEVKVTDMDKARARANLRRRGVRV